MRILFHAAVLLVASQLFGCASVSNGTRGSMRIETVSQSGEPIEGAQCSLTNNKGSVSVTTPGSVLVHRSSSDLHIDCKKDGQPTGSAVVMSRIAGSFFGNILIGGGIGMIVDHSNGSAYNYPEWIKLAMGDSLVFDRKDFVAGAPTAPQGASQKEAGKAAPPPEAAPQAPSADAKPAASTP